MIAILSADSHGINDDRHKLGCRSVVHDDKLTGKNPLKRTANSRAPQIHTVEFVACLSLPGEGVHRNADQREINEELQWLRAGSVLTQHLSGSGSRPRFGAEGAAPAG